MPENSINTPSKQHTRRRGRPSSVRASQSSMFIELDSDGEIMSSQPSDARPQEQDGWNQVVIEISSDEESSDEESFNDNSVDSCLTNKPSIPKQTQHLVAGSPSRSFESDTLKVLRAVLNENRTLKESLDKITADSISLVSQIVCIAYSHINKMPLMKDSHRMYMSCDICCEIMLLPYVYASYILWPDVLGLLKLSFLAFHSADIPFARTAYRCGL